MAKTSTYKTECKKCKSPVYYYPAKLLLEYKIFKDTPEDKRRRVVDCTCTGETDSGKHTMCYTYPNDFTKVE